MLFLFGGDVRTEGTLFCSDGSELAMEGAKDLFVTFVTDDDWWDVLLEATPAMSSIPLDHCWW